MFTINITEGRSAFVKNSPCFKGVFTSGFTECNVLLIEPEHGGIFLAHVNFALIVNPDNFTKFIQEINQFFTAGKITIFFRNENSITTFLKSELPKKFSSVKINFEKIPTTQDGVQAFFDEQGKVTIKLYAHLELPAGLIRHPKEFEIIKLQTIKKMFPTLTRAFLKENPSNGPAMLVFLENNWTTIDDVTSIVIKESELGKEQNFLNELKDLPLLTMTKKIFDRIASNYQTYQIPLNIPMGWTTAFIAALNMSIIFKGIHNYEKNFKENMRELTKSNVQGGLFILANRDEKITQAVILKILTGADPVAAMEKYLEILKLSGSWISLIKDNFKYQQFVYYELKHYSRQNTKTLLTCNSEGAHFAKTKDYPNAKVAFFNALQIALECLSPQQDLFLLVLYNYSRTLYHLNEVAEAEKFLRYGLELRKKLPTDSNPKIETIEKALQECQKNDEQKLTLSRPPEVLPEMDEEQADLPKTFP